jgi:hypothetical protein
MSNPKFKVFGVSIRVNGLRRINGCFECLFMVKQNCN